MEEKALKIPVQPKEIQDLIDRGKQKGFLTFDEVHVALPPDVVQASQLDDVLAVFDNLDIAVVDSEDQFKSLKKKDDAEPDAEGEAEDEPEEAHRHVHLVSQVVELHWPPSNVLLPIRGALQRAHYPVQPAAPQIEEHSAARPNRPKVSGSLRPYQPQLDVPPP